MITLETDGMFQHYQEGDHHVYMSDDPERLEAIVASNPGRAVHCRRINRDGFVVVTPSLESQSEDYAIGLGVDIMRRWHKQNPCIGVRVLNGMNVSFSLPDPLEEARKDFVEQVANAAHMGACEALKASGYALDDTKAVDLAHHAARECAANIMGVIDGHPGDPLIGHAGYFLMPNDMVSNIQHPESMSGDLLELFYAIDT